MIELIELVSSPQALTAFGIAVLVFGFCPGFLLRQIVRMYPKGHPRRDEIVAELYTINYLMRPIWVAAQLETGMHEGLRQRYVGWKDRRRVARLEARSRDERPPRPFEERGVRGLTTGRSGWVVTRLPLSEPLDLRNFPGIGSSNDFE